MDMGGKIKCKSFADTMGHYSHFDLTWLGVDTRDKLVVRALEELPCLVAEFINH